MPKSKEGPTLQRFNERFEKNESTGCWIWTGCRDSKGYGRINHTGAHRISWALFRGAIPVGLHVLHKCDTPLCVNPEHLFLGTHRDNVADMVKKGRHTCRVTPEQIHEIRTSSESERDLGLKLGISRGTVGDIRRGKSWKLPPVSGRRLPGGAKGKNQNAQKTHCLRGHEFDWRSEDGRRRCTTCDRLRRRAPSVASMAGEQ
jgi:hypothetical protein